MKRWMATPESCPIRGALRPSGAAGIVTEAQARRRALSAQVGYRQRAQEVAEIVGERVKLKAGRRALPAIVLEVARSEAG